MVYNLILPVNQFLHITKIHWQALENIRTNKQNTSSTPIKFIILAPETSKHKGLSPSLSLYLAHCREWRRNAIAAASRERCKESENEEGDKEGRLFARALIYAADAPAWHDEKKKWGRRKEASARLKWLERVCACASSYTLRIYTRTRARGVTRISVVKGQRHRTRSVYISPGELASNFALKK